MCDSGLRSNRNAELVVRTLLSSRKNQIYICNLAIELGFFSCYSIFKCCGLNFSEIVVLCFTSNTSINHYVQTNTLLILGRQIRSEYLALFFFSRQRAFNNYVDKKR